MDTNTDKDVKTAKLGRRGSRPNLKAAVNIVWILCKTCMFLGVFRFAKKLKFLRAGFKVFPGLSGTLLLYALVFIGRNDVG